MAKKKTRPDTASAAPDRDLVTFYARLVRTLENNCGRDALAQRLADLRHAAPNSEADSGMDTALSRMFRRLGLVGAKDDAGRFAEDFAGRLGAAVTRPEHHVLFMLRVFCHGDDTLGMRPVCGATPNCLACQLTRECEYFNNPRKPAMALLTPAARIQSGNEEALSDAELLSVILYGDKGTGGEPVVATLMTRYGRLRALFRAAPHEFQGIRDMGKPQSLRLAAIAALHRRLLEERRGDMLRITSAQDIFNRYVAEMREFQVEVAVLLMLDQQNQVIRDAWFYEGSPNLSHVTVADLLRPAVREFATRVALIHNHPTGNANPSTGDVDFTRRLRSACDLFGLVLVDHVIVTENGYYSFAEAGMLGI